MKLAALLLVVVACAEATPPPKDVVDGGSGPWAIARDRMGEYALKNLELSRGSLDLEVVETETRTTYRSKTSGRAITLRVLPAFAKRFLDVPPGVAERAAMELPDREVFEAVAQPNDKVSFFGLDGEFSSDQPAAPKCTADYAPQGRNPGLVRFTRGEAMSFYEDRAGARPIAEDCHYAYRGFTPDPKYFGIDKEQSPTSLWLAYELTSGAPACEKFRSVIVRPPEGADGKRHLHLRYGASVQALVALSAGPTTGVCDPWWSVYCTRGHEDCDDD